MSRSERERERERKEGLKDRASCSDFRTQGRGQSSFCSERRGQNQFVLIHSPVSKKNATQALLCLFSLQPALTSRFGLSLHRFTGSTLPSPVPGVAAEWQKRSRHEMRTETVSPGAPTPSEHSKHWFLQRAKRTTGQTSETSVFGWKFST